MDGRTGTKDGCAPVSPLTPALRARPAAASRQRGRGEV